MRIHCPHEGCEEHPKFFVFQDYDCIRYSLECCEEHQDWAAKLLDDHVTQRKERLNG